MHQSLLFFSLTLCFSFIACGGPQSTPVEDDSPWTSHLSRLEEGELILEDDSSRIGRRNWFRLLPSHWPNVAGEPPVLGIGRVVRNNDENYAIFFANRQVNDVTEHFVEVSRSQPEFSDTKLLIEIAEVNDRNIAINVGSIIGVSEGDTYFILNRQPDEPLRLASYIGGIVQITSVEEDAARGEILHADQRVQNGDLLRFAQIAPMRRIPPVTIAFAPLHENGSQSSVLLETLPDQIEEYGLTNIVLQELNQFIDPRPDDAPDTAENHAPEEGYGIIAFGTQNDSGLVYNIAHFGEAPSAHMPIGILSGGLEIDASVSEYAAPIAHSTLAAGLMLRGDLAMGMYIAELGTRISNIPRNLRFHLRENVISASEELGFLDEALMTARLDIEQSTEENWNIPLLNALSVRAGIATRNDNYLLAQRDNSQFLTIAAEILPEEALLYPQFGNARILSSLGETNEAITAIELLLSSTRQNPMFSYFAAIELAFLYYGENQFIPAMLLFSDAERFLTEAEENGQADLSDRVQFHAYAAFFYSYLTLLAEQGESLEMSRRELLAESQAHFEVTIRYLPALSVDMQAEINGILADIEIAFGNQDAAIERNWETANLELDSAQYENAVLTLVDLSSALMDIVMTENRSDAYEMSLESLQIIDVAENIAFHIGNLSDSASLLMLAGAITWYVQDYDFALEIMDMAILYATKCADYQLLSNIYENLADMISQRGDSEQEAEYRALSELWRNSAEFGR